MELDVHLKRVGDESWGFRLIGGKDFKMPLTVVKVALDSPAARAGLQNGDTVCSVNGSDASEMSHDSAKQFVADAVDTLELGVRRGLYDPVLDEYEPIYEPIDQEDFDQPSQPTEVDLFQIQQFLDPNKPSREASELKDIEPGFTPLSDGLGLDLSRSLTASPYISSTKPYRPFSTEPLPIPPLEDPIILNPNYKDTFGKLGDGVDDEGLPETKFKLPISEQYDPDGTKKKRKDRAGSIVNKEVKFNEEGLIKDVVVEESKLSEEMKMKTALEEKMYMEKMKNELDLNKIEMTAVSLVDESIERAVSVADEIKKEIEVELNESSVIVSNVEKSQSVEESSTNNVEISSSETVEAAKSVQKSVVVSEADEMKKEMNEELRKSSVISFNVEQSQSIDESSKTTEMSSSETLQATKSVQKASKDTSEMVDFVDKKTEEMVEYSENKTVSKAVQKFKTLDKKEQAVDERRLSTKQEIKETIELGSVRRKSEVFDKKQDVKTVDSSQKVEKSEAIQQTQAKIVDAKDANKKAVNAETVSQSARKMSEIKKEAVSSQKSETTSSDSKENTTRNFSEHKAYKIGLQTIPNIKGTIHSSYHYNLLLKTFFIHLTDVMVALSRFILTEPVFNKTEDGKEVKNVTTEQSVSEFKAKYVNEEIVQEDRREEQKIQSESTINERKKELFESDENRVEKQEAVISAAIQETEHVAEEKNYADEVQANLEVEEIIEKQKLSGAQMAQVQERKSAELTQKMDAVITEFQTKAGIEETEVVRERRSRSRSHIEEEVARESDPLEWLSKVDQKQSMEITELKSESKSFSSTTESLEKKKLETKTERREKSSKSKEGKQMYVAIVESHVFTNKDAIFEEQATDFSETSSVQSADEVNMALQASETIATEKVSLESNKLKEEIAESVLEESREVSVVNSQTEHIKIADEVTELKAIVEKVTESKAIVEEVTESKAIVEEVIESKAVVEEVTESKAIVKEAKEEKAVEAKEEIQTLEVKEEAQVMTVSEKTEVDNLEMHESIAIQEVKQEEHSAIKIEESIVLETALESVTEELTDVKKKEVEVIAPVQVESVELELTQPATVTPTFQEDSADLKIIKEEVIEKEQILKLSEESELNVSKHTEISETESQYSEVRKSKIESYESKEIVQESSFTATLAEQKSTMTLAEQKSSLKLDLTDERTLEKQSSSSSIPSTIDTPTPSTIPPTPLTDEYVFKLHIPLPKNTGITVPRDCTPTPEDEDPNIVKKKLIPYIDTTLESPVIYDPPLPTPPEDKVQPPVYTKPGLKGGAERRRFKKEEILEIGRKSSLLASAIDETIKSIEEYKEEVGIDTKKEVTVKEETKLEQSTKSYEKHAVSKKETVKFSNEEPIIYNGYAKVETKVYNNVDHKIEEEWNKIDQSVKNSNDKLVQLSNGLEIKENGITNGNDTEVDSTVASIENSREIKRNLIETEPKSIEVSKSVNGVETLPVKNTVKFETMESDKTVNANGYTSFNEVIRFNIKPLDEIVTNGNKPGDVSAAFVIEQKKDPMEGYRPIQFNPEELVAARRGLQSIHLSVQEPMFPRAPSPSYVSSTGELLGTHQGIVDGLEEAVVDEAVAKELGKPGMTETKIAELISGESEMLREAHVMGLSRVLKSHMHRADDDSSVDFKKIKPIIESLKDSEVLKALNDELIRTAEEKKKEEEKKWTTFLQKPKRPVPRVKFGYFGHIQEEERLEEPYKVKIVKQPKPKVAPDYKPEDFETGPLPWEERALNEPPPPPVEAEDPILIPEEVPEFLEAVDPLPESEVPDLEETGIPLPPPKQEEERIPSPVPVEDQPIEQPVEETEAELESEVIEETKPNTEMDQNRLADQLMMGVQSMVDPNASVEQQLAQMRAQMAALAQLPNVIQQTLDLVSRQLSQLSQQETNQVMTVSETQMQSESRTEMQSESHECVEVTENNCEAIQEESNNVQEEMNQEEDNNEKLTITEVVEETKPSLTQEEMEKLRKEEEEMLEEQRRIEKQKKELMEQMKLEQESRQVKQRPTPRVGKPKPVFGPPVPQVRPLVLPGGRKWRKPADAYNEQFFAETLAAQAELIQGKAKGLSFESDILPYDQRINFMKYEKPPVSLDHLQHSDVYKLIHNMEQEPMKRLEMRTPVMAEADYREKCRSDTPCGLAIV